jgi:hypothetical protein
VIGARNGHHEQVISTYVTVGFRGGLPLQMRA